MILDVIQISKEQKTLIGFNFYSSDRGFYCGYVLDYSEEFVIIQHFSKFGLNDGILVHQISDIQYFETDTDYLKGVQQLIQKQHEILKPSYSFRKKKEHLESFTNLFESFIGDKDYMLKFELKDGEIYFGFVEWCDEDFFSIICIESDGMINGKATYRLEDLKSYWIDDLECRKRKILFKAKNPSR